jgi:hypothetical protein
MRVTLPVYSVDAVDRIRAGYLAERTYKLVNWLTRRAGSGAGGVRERFVADALVDELIVDDRGGQKTGASLRISILVLCLFTLLVFGADHSTLTENIAVLLA